MNQPLESLPEPLTPVGCDMGRNDWYPLYFDRLRQSRWWRRSSDLARARNIMLWGEAYKQVPAGSLPDDDDELAEAAGFGFDVPAFLAAKAEILAPWVMCSDGRWYHPTLCEVVLEAWEKVSERRKAERIKKANQRAEVRAKRMGVPAQKAAVPAAAVDVPRDSDDVPGDTPQNQPGHSAQERKGPERKVELETSSPVASASPPAPKGDPWDQDKLFGVLWNTCTPEMRKRAKSRAKVWPEWVKAKKVSDPQVIVAAMGMYLLGDPDVKRTGGPGLHSWLKDRTWENWNGGSTTGPSVGEGWSVETWRGVVARWRSEGSWDVRLGPEPGQPGCRVPSAALIHDADGEPS